MNTIVNELASIDGRSCYVQALVEKPMLGAFLRYAVISKEPSLLRILQCNLQKAGRKWEPGDFQIFDFTLR